MKAPCTLKDLLPIEQAQQVVDWFDSRPLTDETLEELGFEKPLDAIYDFRLPDVANSWGLFADIENEEYYISFNFPMDATKPIPTYKTVGSVKMLIEALKGD